ncbi:MAG TPA: OB-fold domain-containing protein [Mycobacteriales bacterium]|nr:OB-fold domain-containing protein [Mycobacteriales bacterium]
MSEEVLTAPHVVEYTYTRSTGPAIGAFLTALRDKKFVGVRASDGRVIVPAIDYDPVTSEDLSDYVEVADTGVVTTWSWNDKPTKGQPLDKPFAWALVKLEGADVPFLAAVDAGSPDAISTGAKVTARWRDERVGSITDLVCFEVMK